MTTVITSYLYIGEDGLLRQSRSEPDSDDLQSVIDETMQIVIFDDGKFKVCEANEIEPESDDDDSTYEITGWREIAK